MNFDFSLSVIQEETPENPWSPLSSNTSPASSISSLSYISRASTANESLGDIIERSLQQSYPLAGSTERKTLRNTAVKFLYEFEEAESQSINIDEILKMRDRIDTELFRIADCTHQFYHSFSLDPVEEDGLTEEFSMSELAEIQRELVKPLLALERKRCGFIPNEEASSLPDRFFSQVSFFSFLESDKGREVASILSQRMGKNQKRVFKKTIREINELSKNYLKLLSVIEAIRKQVKILFQDKYNHIIDYYYIQPIIDTMDFDKEKFLLPMGWAATSEEGVGHHSIFLIEKDKADNEEAVISVFDIASSDGEVNVGSAPAFHAEKNFNSLETNDKESWSLEELLSEISEIEKNKPPAAIAGSALELKMCAHKFKVNEYEDKILLLAQSMMLQIPLFANQFQNDRAEYSSKELTPVRIQSLFYSKIYYPMHKSSPLTSESHSPLDSWEGGDEDSCAFSTLLPLMQTFAKNTMVDLGVSLLPHEETGLGKYFRVLLDSHKLFLLDHILIPQQTGLNLEIPDQEIAEMDILKSYLISSINSEGL